jgi:hypothetical protein
MTYHVLTKSAALALGIIDANGNEQQHSVTPQQISDAAESEWITYAQALFAAGQEPGGAWVIDPEGNSEFAPPGMKVGNHC